MTDLVTFLSGLALQSVFVASVACVAARLAYRWYPHSGLLIRAGAAAIACGWLLSVLFAVLMTLRLFRPVPATAAALVLAWLAGLLRSAGQDLKTNIIRDGEVLRALIQSATSGWTAVGVAAFAFLAALLLVRSLSLPLLGWDTLTHHGVKTALWIRAGGWADLNAPGGWEYYRSFFGGGESFTAWSMLFVHSDAFAGIPDVFFWGLLGLAITGLGRFLGFRRRTAFLVAAAFLSSYEVSRYVGSGYVDNCGTGWLLLGILFLLRFLREGDGPDLLIAAASLGLAGSVKINLLATALALAVAAFLWLWLHRACAFRNLAVAASLLAAPVLPWLLYNWVTVGYPLGCVPLSVGQIKLGEAPPNLRWLLRVPELIQPYRWGPETAALSTALRTYGLTLVLPTLGMLGWCRGMRRFRSGYVLLLLAVAAVTAQYFSPSFSLIRLDWPITAGRFLLPALAIAAVAGLPPLCGRAGGRRLVEVLCVAATLMGVVWFTRAVLWRGPPAEFFFAVLAAAGLLVFLHLVRCPAAPGGPAFRVAGLTAAALAAWCVAFAEFKDAFRLRAYESCITVHDFPRYWLPGLRVLYREPEPARVAAAYGARRVTQYVFLAPLFGSHLENDVVYVSPDESGRVIPFHPDTLAGARPRYELWLQRLRRQGVTHVFSFVPPGVEISWMLQHPEHFRRLAGIGSKWGLFRLIPNGSPPPSDR